MSDLLYTLVVVDDVVVCVDYDRPVWFHSSNNGMRLIPESPESITQDAVIFFGLNHLDLPSEMKSRVKSIIEKERKDQGSNFLIDLTEYPAEELNAIRGAALTANLSGHVQVILHGEKDFNFGCEVKSPCIATCKCV